MADTMQFDLAAAFAWASAGPHLPAFLKIGKQHDFSLLDTDQMIAKPFHDLQYPRVRTNVG